ncbi:MAG TPA: phosphatase PAP2 family protein [Candidatus Eisenbacteria bacterium]|nr:phosphatase PAP2 family protein [Candidatus Eisenbacteria bacterium]
MKPFTLACAKVGVCLCCFFGASRASAASAEHPLAPMGILATLEDAAPSAPPATATEAPTAPLAAAALTAPPSPTAAADVAGPAGAFPESGTVLRAPRAVGGVSAGFMSKLDHDTFKPGTWDNSFFERAGRDLGSPASLLGGTALFAAQGLATGDHEQVETAGLMGLGYLGTSATVQGLKSITGRTRPDGSDDYSFPSGHTANSFLAAAVLAREYGGATAVVSYGAATLVGASRIAGGRHHFSDVLVGAVIGQIFGFLVTSLDK